jgi:hypothetical protein
MKLAQLRNDIVEIINKSNLEADCIYFVLQDIMNNIAVAYNEELKQIEEEKQKKENEKKLTEEFVKAMSSLNMEALEQEKEDKETPVQEAEEIEKTEEE